MPIEHGKESDRPLVLGCHSQMLISTLANLREQLPSSQEWLTTVLSITGSYEITQAVHTTSYHGDLCIDPGNLDYTYASYSFISSHISTNFLCQYNCYFHESGAKNGTVIATYSFPSPGTKRQHAGTAGAIHHLEIHPEGQDTKLRDEILISLLIMRRMTQWPAKRK